MTKDNQDTDKPNEPAGAPVVDDVELEEKVRQMMDPEIKPEGAPEPPETATNQTKAASETESETKSLEAPAELTAPMSEPVRETKPKPSLFGRLGDALKSWWHNPLKRNLTLAALLVLIGVAAMVPASRYFILNSAGVRSQASLTILDDSTQQPLKNVQIKLGDLTGQTNDKGRVEFQRVRLGRQRLQFERRAFAGLNRDVVIGWGSNPLGEFKLTPTGSQYSFVVADYLSGKPLPAIEASSGEFSAISDDKGEIKLTMEDTADQPTAEVTVSGPGLRKEIINLDLASKEAINLAMVPDKQHYFVTKRSGRYDIYKIDVDGKNEELVLAGSGSERDEITLVPSPSSGYVALVSTRENVRNSDGFLLSTLTLLEPDSSIPVKLAQSERIQIVDWVGDYLVFVQISDGASAADPDRHRLFSHNVKTGQAQQLAAANYFNDVLAVNGSIYYAPSQAYNPGAPGFYKLSADGGGRQTVMDVEVWNIIRSDYGKLVIASGTEWYELNLPDSKLTTLSGQPPNVTSRVYVNDEENQKSVWVDRRDGKGVLLVYDIQSRNEDMLHEQSGLQNPVRWLNSQSVVYRVSNGQEVADYIKSINGGEPRKIRDVTDTSGIDTWYYY